MAATDQEIRHRIYDLAGICEGLFEALLSVLSRISEQGYRIVQEHQQRFESWAGYLGVFAAPQASLDSRLKSAPDIEYQIIQLLEIVKRNIQYGLKFESVRVPSQPEAGSSASEKQEGEQADTTQPPISPGIRAALDGIHGAIDRLHRLGTAIRKAPMSNIFSRVKKFAEKDIDDHAVFERMALLVIKGLYPDISDSFVRQLSTSVSFRRQRLLYQRRHQQKLKTRRPKPKPKLETPEPILHQNEIPQYDLKPAHEEPEDREVHVAKEAPSMSSKIYASTITFPSAIDSVAFHPNIVEPPEAVVTISGPRTVTSVAQNNPYPPPPKLQDGEKYCQCNWCFKELRVPDERNRWKHIWRSHFKEDLEPYVCISEECSEQPVYFASLRSWRKHMDEFHTEDWAQGIHRPIVWYCDLNQHEYEEFPTAEVFEKHLSESHNELTPERLERMAKRNILSVSRGPNICPLCLQDISVLDIEPNPVDSSSDLRNPPRTAPSRAHTKKATFQIPEDPADSDEETSTGLDTDIDISKESCSGTIDNSQELVDRIKLTKHIALHLKSLAFISLRYFDDESSAIELESQNAALGAGAEEFSSQGQNQGDHHFDLDSSLSFEDVPPDQRVLFNEAELARIVEEGERVVAQERPKHIAYSNTDIDVEELPVLQKTEWPNFLSRKQQHAEDLIITNFNASLDPNSPVFIHLKEFASFKPHNIITKHNLKQTDTKQPEKSALYKFVILCDDCWPMRADRNYEEKTYRITKLINRLEVITQRAAIIQPSGLSIRFLNDQWDRRVWDNIAYAETIEYWAAVRDWSHIPAYVSLGSELNAKVIRPLIVQKIQNGEFTNPLIVLVLTNGEFTDEEDEKAFVDAIMRYKESAENKSSNGDAAVVFIISRIDADRRFGDRFFGNLERRKELKEWVFFSPALLDDSSALMQRAAIIGRAQRDQQYVLKLLNVLRAVFYD